VVGGLQGRRKNQTSQRKDRGTCPMVWRENERKKNTQKKRSKLPKRRGLPMRDGRKKHEGGGVPRGNNDPWEIMVNGAREMVGTKAGPGMEATIGV